MATAEATGAFKVTIWDEQPFVERAGGKLTRAAVTAHLEGDIEGTGSVSWLMCYRADGTADYVGFLDVEARGA